MNVKKLKKVTTKNEIKVQNTFPESQFTKNALHQLLTGNFFIV